MSIDVNALFAIGRDYRGAEWLRSQLAAEPPGLKEAVARFRHLWIPEAWIATASAGLTNIVGPGGFSLRVSTKIASLYHVLPWKRFTRDDEARAILRRACVAIGALLGSPRAIYLHELLPVGSLDGASLAVLEEQLRASFGAPSPTFEALADAGEFSTGCWYIDDLGA